MIRSSHSLASSSAQVGSYTVSYLNSEEFHRVKKEIFSQHVYYFETSNPQPKIIDAGAHTGLATLYFKKLFPAAHITALEPLPQNFKLLEENVWQNNLNDIQTLEMALWPITGTIQLHYDQTPDRWFSTASTLPKAWNQQQSTTFVDVPSITLSSLLNEPVDFLKLDIEGAEQAVIEEATNQLENIREMIIEFHPTPQQSLLKLTALLEEKNFKVEVWKDSKEVEAKRAKGLVYLHAQQ